jgi:hypothetical protein
MMCPEACYIELRNQWYDVFFCVGRELDDTERYSDLAELHRQMEEIREGMSQRQYNQMIRKDMANEL